MKLQNFKQEVKQEILVLSKLDGVKKIDLKNCSVINRNIKCNLIPKLLYSENNPLYLYHENHIYFNFNLMIMHFLTSLRSYSARKEIIKNMKKANI